MYGLTAEDQRIRDTARAFVDSLIPHEAEAEELRGHLPPQLAAQHHDHAIELGLYATNMPVSVGGPGFTALQQVLVQEQVGRATNALAWVMHTPPQWWVDVATDYQQGALAVAVGPGRSTRPTRDHRGVRGLRRLGARIHRRTTATTTSSTGSSGMSRRSTSPTTSSCRLG